MEINADDGLIWAVKLIVIKGNKRASPLAILECLPNRLRVVSGLAKLLILRVCNRVLRESDRATITGTNRKKDKISAVR